MTESTTGTDYRVVNLVAENYKRIKAVDITPDPNSSTVTIAGRNAQGKSSVIDAIWAALAGTAATKGTATTRPIRDGENTARVTVDLGNIIVTRTWEGDKTALKVESQEGARFGSPQKMLDELIGRLSFDPLAFASLAPKAQQAELLQLVELPFDPAILAFQRKAAFDDRTDVGRVVKQLQGQLAGFPEIGDDVPDEPVSVAALIEELDIATSLQVDAENAAINANHAARAVADAEQGVTRAEEHLAAMRADLAKAEAHRNRLPEPPEVEPIRTRINNVEEVNAAVRQKHQRQEVGDLLDAEKSKRDALTDKIAELDKTKTDGLAAATFPIDGLGFDDEGVTYRGVPFAQSSAAERLRVSVAMAMAMNPKIRVIRITDGSLLDSENLALIEEMAAAEGFQVWIERVDETGKVGVIIEDGEVKA